MVILTEMKPYFTVGGCSWVFAFFFFPSGDLFLHISITLKAAAYLRTILKCQQPSYLSGLGIYRYILTSDALCTIMIHDPLEKFLMANEFLKKSGTGRGGYGSERNTLQFFLCCKNALDSIIFLFHIRVKPRYKNQRYKVVQRSLMIWDLIWGAKDPGLSPWYPLYSGMTVWSLFPSDCSNI